MSLDAPEVEPLLAGLHEFYVELYGDTGSNEMSLAAADEFVPPDGVFVVAITPEGTTCAGGGFRRHGDGVCEVKRMWTAPTHRRQGLASLVLGELEARAATAGYRRLVLETGPLQREAAAMYAARGYRRIEPFGPYPEALAFEVDLPVQVVVAPEHPPG